MGGNGHGGKAERLKFVGELQRMIRTSSGLVFIGMKGLNSSETYGLRRSLRPSGAKLKVVKNRLMRIALKEEHVTGCDEWLKLDTAVVFLSDDPLAAVKAIATCAEEVEKLKFKGALVEGRAVDGAGLKELAKLPGRSALLTMAAASMKAPLVRAVMSFHGVMRKLAVAMREAAKKAKE